MLQSGRNKIALNLDIKSNFRCVINPSIRLSETLDFQNDVVTSTNATYDITGRQKR